MERLIFSDSPLAEYLEGQGNADNEWTSMKPQIDPPSPPPLSFAPSGFPRPYAKFRRKFPQALKLDVPTSKSEAVARLHETCSSALHYRLQRAENASFLEQFRYTIVASQLLNQHANPINYRHSLGQQDSSTVQDADAQIVGVSWLGLGATAGGAFAIALSLHWARSFAQKYTGIGGILTLLAGLGIALTVFYGLFRRQWLKYLRKQAIESASQLVTEAQRLDATMSTAINLIQEVELVSRGYRLSNPLPPISRLEDTTQNHQTKRCARLRKQLRFALTSTQTPYTTSYSTLKPHMIDADFDRYCDIYEITLSDLHSLPLSPTLDPTDDPETIKSLKSSFQSLHLARKLLLCTLLALDADGGAQDFSRWTLAIDAMNSLSAASSAASTSLDKILCEEDRAFPITPRSPLPCHPNNPQRDRTRAQIRKIGALSQGIRTLQAKMHILREESDRTLAASDDATDAPNLMAQYESIGADLRSLMQEWEEGKAHLATSADTHSRRISASGFPNLGAMMMSPTGAKGWHRHSRSSTPSLGGLTLVGGGSPRESLHVPLAGSPRLGATAAAAARSGSVGSPPSLSGASSDEEVFEAVAMPRVRERSELSREERIAKMRDERAERERRRESAGVKVGVLRELETVIGVRRGRSVSVAVVGGRGGEEGAGRGGRMEEDVVKGEEGRQRLAGNRLSLPPVGL